MTEVIINEAIDNTLLSIRSGDAAVKAAIGNCERLSSVALRYLTIVQSNAPELSVAEWSTIQMATWSVYLEGRPISAEGLSYNLIEAARCEGVGKNFGVDVDGLARRMRDFTEVQTISMIEVIERLRLLSDHGHWGMAENLKALGVRIAR